MWQIPRTASCDVASPTLAPGSVLPRQHNAMGLDTERESQGMSIQLRWYPGDTIKPGLYFESKSMPYVRGTILRMWCTYSRPTMPIYAVVIVQMPSINTLTPTFTRTFSRLLNKNKNKNFIDLKQQKYQVSCFKNK